MFAYGYYKYNIKKLITYITKMTDHVHCLIYFGLKNNGLLYQVLIIVNVI